MPKSEYLECDTEQNAQEYCDEMTALMCNGQGPQPGNVTQVYAVPRQTLLGKWMVPKHPNPEKHAQRTDRGRPEKHFDSTWFEDNQGDNDQ